MVGAQSTISKQLPIPAQVIQSQSLLTEVCKCLFLTIDVIIANVDMGCAELDDSYMAQTVKASLNTTKRIQEQLDKIDFVLQIGDISYALGYSSMVCLVKTVIERESYVEQSLSVGCIL